MKLIKSKAEYLPQTSGLEGVYRQIELAGRTCYKSSPSSTSSPSSFVDRMIKSGHGAMLEHGTIYLKIPIDYRSINVGNNYAGGTKIDFVLKCPYYESNSYSRSSVVTLNEGMVYPNIPYGYNFKGGIKYQIVTTNLRVLQENNWLDDLQYLCEPTEFHEKRYTFKLTTSIGVSRELIRHRTLSFAEQSTRYCNYSRDKFNNQVSFCIPEWCDFEDAQIEEYEAGDFRHTRVGEYALLCGLAEAENNYMTMLSDDWQPQQAREVLPLCTATEIVVTGFASDWRHFFDLRLFEKTGKAHPNMKQLAKLMQIEAGKQGILEDIICKPSKFE